MFVRAHYEFKTDTCEPGTARSSTLQYETESKEEAVVDFSRWWNNRHQAVPEHFQLLCAVNFTEVNPQRVSDAGYLPPDHGIPFAEWKLDFPWPLMQTYPLLLNPC